MSANYLKQAYLLAVVIGHVDNRASVPILQRLRFVYDGLSALCVRQDEAGTRALSGEGWHRA